MRSSRNKHTEVYSSVQLQTRKTTSGALGEDHLSGTIAYTMQKITDLGIEVDSLKSTNQNLNQKLTGSVNQRVVFVEKNLLLEDEIIKTQQLNQDLLAEKSDKEAELYALQKEFESIQGLWDEKRKELELELKIANETKKKALNDQHREKMVLDNQTTNIAKQLHTKRGEIKTSRPEYTKNQVKINDLEIKEANSARAIISDLQRFKRFLDNVSST